MSEWFTRNLGDALLVGEALEHIKTLFLAAHAQSSGSNEMAVFIRHVSEGRLHCEVRIYFSPATAHVAEAVGAINCQKPAPVGLGLLAGSEEAWAVLFPERRIGISEKGGQYSVPI